MGKITLSDIAAASGYSTMHVSRALNGDSAVSPETREAICRTARTLGYKSTKAAVKPIAVITPSYFHFPVRVLNELKRRGMHGVLLFLNNLELANEKNFSGALSVCCGDSLPQIWNKNFTLPLIQVHDYALQSGSISGVVSDCDDEMRQSVSHLAELGHQRIVWIKEMIAEHYGIRYRNRGEAGFFDTAQKYNIASTVSIYTFADTQEKHKNLEKAINDGTTGFIINEYRYYQWIFDIFRRRNIKIPQDASVIVYDCDGTRNNYHPHLTALQLDYDRLVQRAVDLLELRLSGDNHTIQERIPSHLLTGESTAPCR